MHILSVLVGLQYNFDVNQLNGFKLIHAVCLRINSNLLSVKRYYKVSLLKNKFKSNYNY